MKCFEKFGTKSAHAELPRKAWRYFEKEPKRLNKVHLDLRVENFMSRVSFRRGLYFPRVTRNNKLHCGTDARNSYIINFSNKTANKGEFNCTSDGYTVAD